MVCLSACWDTPLGVGLETPWVWAWNPPAGGPRTPLGVGLETPQVWAWRPPQVRPLNLPPWMWAWRPPPRPDPSTSPLGVGLETCKACWDTTPWIPAAMHAGIPPAAVNRMTDRCKNITLHQTSFAGCNYRPHSTKHLTLCIFLQNLSTLTTPLGVDHFVEFVPPCGCPDPCSCSITMEACTPTCNKTSKIHQTKYKIPL